MYFLPLVMVSLAVAGGFFFPDQFEGLWFLPFLISALFLGLPHGAADWGLLKRAVQKKGWQGACGTVATYLSFILLAGVVTIAFPIVGLLLFLGVSAWHFGSADAYDFHKQFKIAASHGTRTVNALARGVLIIAAPLAFQVETMFQACDQWCGILEGSWLPEALMDDLERVGRFLLFYALLILVGHSLSLVSEGSGKAVFMSLAEPLLLLGLFAITHPLFALGYYFVCWHSLRHLSHLKPLRRRPNETGWLYRLAGPFWIPSLIVIAAFSLVTGNHTSPQSLTIILIIFFAIVTPAHQWLVHREVHAH